MLADAGRSAFGFDDEVAFTSSLEPLLPIAFRLANGMLRNRDDAQDAVQEAAAKAWRKRSDQPGSLNWVFYEISPGHRVTIYRGSYGDATGAILSEATADSTGIWFVSFDSRVVWHWQQNTGLRKLLLTGLPQRLTGANTYIQVRPKGVCF